MTLCGCEMPVDHHFFVEQHKKKLHHQPKTALEMFTAGTETPASKTQEAKHRQNNNVLNVNLTCCLDFMSSVTANKPHYSFEQGPGPLTAPKDLRSC